MNSFPEMEPVGVRRGLFWAGILLLAFFFLVDLAIGSVSIPFRDVFSILWTGKSESQGWLYIVQKIRIPKAITAVLAGGGLAVGGLQMQTLFRNPLAGPSELGITAGSGLGVASVILGGGAGIATIKSLGIGGSWLVVAASAMGAGLVFALVLLFARRIQDNVVLLLLGVMLSALTMAAVSIWQYFSSPEQLQEYIMWTFGALNGVTGSQLAVLAAVVLTGWVLALISIKYLNLLLLGEAYARSMGVSVGKARLIIMIGTCLLTGAITAFCGPIGFVGIAVPHLARTFFRTSDHRVLVPAVLVTGAILLLICDIIAQLPGNGVALPVNVVTSLFGAPVVIWVILKSRNIRNSF